MRRILHIFRIHKWFTVYAQFSYGDVAVGTACEFCGKKRIYRYG